MSRRLWTWILGIPVVAGVAVAATFRDDETMAQRFETAIIARGDIEETISAFGKLQPRDYVDVGAQASGQLLRLHVREGDKVRKGRLLAEIDATMQQALVDANKAEIAQLEAQLRDLEIRARFAATRAEREEKLRRVSATSADRHDQMQMEAAAASAQMELTRAQIHQVRATLRANEAQLGYTRIYAPMDGTVISVEARQGQTLVATYQTVQLLRIADLSVMTVWTQVAEADVPKLAAGMPVWFTTLGHEGRKWEAQVRQILPGPERPENAEATTNARGNTVVFYTALFDVPNPDGDLRPEMSAQTFFVTKRANGVIVAPVAALTPVDGQADRFTARVLAANGKPETRSVRVGLRTRFQAEVLDQLGEGERIITGERAEEGGLKIRFTP